MTFPHEIVSVLGGCRLRRLVAVGLALVTGTHGEGATPPVGEGPATDPDFTALTLEELGAVVVPTVVGASKREQSAADAPASVSVVTGEDIREYGYRSLGEILAGVRGLYVTTDRAYQFLGIRGMNRLGDYGGRTLLNINGHRMNEPVYDSAFLGLEFPLDVDLIERVEVIRGPGSALYGNNAFFGIVNVVTRPAGQFGERGVEASTAYGSFDTFSGRFSVGQVFTNGLEVLVSANYLESDGVSELRYPASPVAGFPGVVEKDLDGQRVGNFFASASYRGFTLEGLYGRRDKELPNGPYGSIFHDDRNALWDERAYLEARFEREFDGDWRWVTRAYVDHYAYDGVYALDLEGDGTTTLNRDVPRARWWGGEIQVDKRWAEGHRTTLGLEGRHDVEQHQHNYDTEPEVVYIDASKSLYNLGAYLQEEYTVWEDLTFDVGVRYDYFRNFGDTANPRVGVLYRPWSATTLKALYGQAYRGPNAYEYDFEDEDFYKANHDLDPETIRSYEFVWEQNFGEHYRLVGTLFYNQIENLITQNEDTDPADDRLIFTNTDAVDVRGVEIEVEGRWAQGLRATASYALADAVDRANDRRLANSPRHVGTFRVTLPLWPRKVSAGVEMLALGDRETGYGNRVPAQVQANVTLFGREIVKGLEISASLYNLFDKDYHDPAGPDFAQELQPRDGRTFRVKLTYRF